MEILKLVEELEEVVNQASAVPFSNRIMIDKEVISEILEKISFAVPEEVRRAKWIKEEKDQIMSEAKKEAEDMIRTAQEEQARLLDHAKFEENRVIEDARSVADNLISENEITVLAENHCHNLVRTAEETAAEIKSGAYEYADTMLADLEGKLKNFADTIYVNRSELNKYVKREE